MLFGLTLNSLGLLLNIIGTVGLLKYSLPSPYKTGIQFNLEEILKSDDLETVKFGNKMIRDNKRIKILFFISVSLVILGFILQFISSFNSNHCSKSCH